MTGKRIVEMCCVKPDDGLATQLPQIICCLQTFSFSNLVANISDIKSLKAVFFLFYLFFFNKKKKKEKKKHGSFSYFSLKA